MKTLDLLNCARPVLFENDDEEYEYSIGGTAFIVRFYGRIYIVTAKHVLELNKFSLNQFRIQYRPDNKDFIPITELYTIKTTDDEDTDQFDLAILQVGDIGQNEDLFQDHRPYELLEIDKFTIFSPNSKFIYRGFPIELRPIDWEEKQIRHSAFLGHAKYLGPAEWASTHKLELMGCKALSNPDGLSGTPIFQINQDDHGYATEAFAGMLIRSSSQSDIAYFLEHKLIIDTLVDINRGNYSALS